MAALVGETIRETPRILRGTELETPTLTRWNLSTMALLIGGVVALADPIIFFIASALDVEPTLIRRPSVLVTAPFFTAFWATVVVHRARRSASSTRMIGWAVFGAALNAGTIGAVLANAEGAPVVGSVIIGMIGVLVALPASVPVGLSVGLLLWALHDWERELRSAPTQDARVRWLAVAALWVGVVGLVGELLCIPALGHAHRSGAVEGFVWGPHLALIGCAVLSLVGVWRTARLHRFLVQVDAGRVRGLRLGGVTEAGEALTSGRPDGRLVQAEGEGAFRTAQLDLGTVSRRGAQRRIILLVALCIGALTALTVALNVDVAPFTDYRAPNYW